MSTKKNVTWITGASSGIGKSIAEEFAERNIPVVLSSRREVELKNIFSNTKFNSNEIEFYSLDVRNATQVEKTVSSIVETNNIDCLINNAGITTFKSAIDTNFEETKSIIETNLLGAIYTTKSVLPHMIKRNKGIIINIISVAAEKIFTNSSVYSASKAGLLAYSKVLREEVRENKIRIINILPGATNTPIWNSEMLKKFGDRMMSGKDLAKLVHEVYSIDSNVVPEEIIVRPMGGDL
jgi:3-oxoacyl-[acyl-carrier protein] reductase